MEYAKVTCPNCGNKITYWTIRNYIVCQPCKIKIPVEPMKEPEVIEDGVDV